MDRDRLNAWKKIRSKFTGRHRALGIPALVAAMLFSGTRKPSTGSDTRKTNDDGKRADERADKDAAA